MPVLGETPRCATCGRPPQVGQGGRASPSSSPSGWSTATHMCDPHGSDIARFYEHEKTEHHIYARCDEHYNKTYGIVHRVSSGRASAACAAARSTLRGSARRRVLRRPRVGAPAVVRVERRPDGALPRQVRDARARVGRPLVVADHQRRAPPPARARRHGRPDGVQRVRLRGPRRAGVPRVHDGQLVDVPVGRSVYTPLLTGDGGFRGDLTIMRLGETTSGSSPARSTAAATSTGSRRNMPTDGSVPSPIARRASARSASGGQGAGDDGQDRRPAAASRTTSRRPASPTGRCATC